MLILEATFRLHKKETEEFNCAVGQVREKLEKTSDFFSRAGFHFHFVQVSLLAMDIVEHL